MIKSLTLEIQTQWRAVILGIGQVLLMAFFLRYGHWRKEIVETPLFWLKVALGLSLLSNYVGRLAIEILLEWFCPKTDKA